MVVVDEVDLQVSEKTLRDATGRLRGDDQILPPVVECDRHFQRRRYRERKSTMVEGRGEEDELSGSVFRF